MLSPGFCIEKLFMLKLNLCLTYLHSAQKGEALNQANRAFAAFIFCVAGTLSSQYSPTL